MNQSAASWQADLHRIHGESANTRNARMRQCLDLAMAAAPSMRPVLITGETGVGKKFLARFIHRHSPRHARPCVALPCADLKSGDLRNRLFRASQPQENTGLLEKGSGGTLILLGVQELNSIVQNELLDILKTNSFESGEDASDEPGLGRRLGVRIVSTLTIAPGDGAGSGLFLEELLFTLGEITLRLPPLRERREDLDILTRTALDAANSLHGKMVRDLSHSAREFVRHYPFPGNVRELYSMIDQAVRSGGRDAIYVEDMGRVEGIPDEEFVALTDGVFPSLAEQEKRHINKALLRTGWKKSAAARILQISETMLKRKIRLYDLEHDR